MQPTFVPFPDSRPSPFQSSLPSGVVGPTMCGNGSPEGQILGVQGQTYADLLTADAWIKVSGNGNTGWVRNGKASPSFMSSTLGGAQIIYGGPGDPNGVYAATYPAYLYTTDGHQWAKTTPGTDALGWQQQF